MRWLTSERRRPTALVWGPWPGVVPRPARGCSNRPDLLEAQEYVAELRQGEESQWSMDTRYLGATRGRPRSLTFSRKRSTPWLHEGPAFVLTGGAGGFIIPIQEMKAEGDLSTGDGDIAITTGQLFEGQAAYMFWVMPRMLLQAGSNSVRKNRTPFGRLGFQKDLIYDSYLSLVGQESGGQRLGAARSISFSPTWDAGSGGMEWSAHPFGGWVKAESLEPNLETGVVRR